MTPEQKIEQLRRERDAYCQAMHDLVNALRYATDAIRLHMMGEEPDWQAAQAYLLGRVEKSLNARWGPEMRARLERRAQSLRRQEKAAQAVLNMYGTLHMLDALARHPQGEVPFADNIRRAVNEYERERELLSWMLFPGTVAKPEGVKDQGR